jgi:hypothetical protein
MKKRAATREGGGKPLARSGVGFIYRYESQKVQNFAKHMITITYVLLAPHLLSIPRNSQMGA